METEMSAHEQRIELMFERADDLLFTRQQPQKAAPVYQQILKLDPDNLDALNSLAQCLKQQKHSADTFSQCRALYQRALSLDPEDFESNFNMAVLLYEFRKDQDKAIHYFKAALKEEPNATALFNLAVLYEEKGERHEAVKSYQQVLRMEPHHYKAKVNLAIIFEKEGQSEAAFEQYSGAAEESP
jgi:protein O-GlcNAc transferase